mmetsp:Transcript_113432/g.315866  ORF Transcript_113432/g.315866 Transcript_113432/m.315866 type:complete len:1092 (-) Transcript_113432:80-3355(-)
MARSLLCVDAGGILRGECKRCRKCSSFALEEGHRLSFRLVDSAHASDNPSGAKQTPLSEKRQASEGSCLGCGCPAHQHRSLEDWFRGTYNWAQKFQDSNGLWPPVVPDSFTLPAAAQTWDHEAAALYLVTQGQFDPRRDARKDQGRAGHRDEALASVVCTSIEKNHPSHPLLYECFRKQTYEPRELVVVDTGTQPSRFLQEKAKADPRVIYRFYFREEHGLEQDEDSLEHVMNEDRLEEVLQFVTWTPQFAETFDANRSEVPCQGLTLGVKRNIAVHLTRGSTVMHFNAGDLYARDYLRFMRGELLAAASLLGTGGLLPVAVALADWHAVDLSTRVFRQLDLHEHGHHLPEQMRKSLQCARGFTYAYTRKAWEVAAFPNVEQPEGQLVKILEQKRVPFRLVQPWSGAPGLAARGYDKAHITGASAAASMNIAIEIQDLVDCSVACTVPGAFEELLPAVEDLSLGVKRIRDGRINQLLEANGAAFFCSHCDAALALKQYLKDVKEYGDGAGGFVEIAQFSRAGGIVAEGQEHHEALGQRTPAGKIMRSRLTCASPGCCHRVHSLLEMGGYCCVACCESSGLHHGPRCERAVPPTAKYRADGSSLPRDARCAPDPGPLRPQVSGTLMAPVTHTAHTPATLVPLCLSKHQARPLSQQLYTVDPKGGPLARALRSPDRLRASTPVGAGSPLAALLTESAPACRGGPFLLPLHQRTSVNCSMQMERQPDRVPEPVKIAWFPGWSWRNALCRHCGRNIGWRYENSGGAIFWAIEQRHLVERCPPEAHAVSSRVSVTQWLGSEAASDHAVQALPARGAQAEALAAQVDVPKETPEEQLMERRSAEGKSALVEAARKAVQCLSHQLREQLASSLCNASEESCADQALQALRLDDSTREQLRVELRIQPEMADLQADILIAKCFRGNVHTLCQVGRAALCAALGDALSVETSRDAQRASGPPTGHANVPEAATESADNVKKSLDGSSPRPAMEKMDKAMDAGSRVICSFSLELQQQLARGIAVSDGSSFDQTLNGLKLDDSTRENLRQELIIRPGVPALQVEQLIAKCFRSKVNTLRSLGLRKLRAALEQALPEGSLDSP